MRKYITAEYKIHLQKPSLPAGSFRAVFLSDMHNSCNAEETEELLGRISAADPDLVLCGGDMIVARNRQPVETAAGFMRRLSSLYPVWLGTGNHEYRARIYPEVYGDMYPKYKKLLEDAEVHFLEDAFADVEVPLHPACGHGDPESGSAGKEKLPVRIFGFDLEASFYSRFIRHPLPCDIMREQIGCPDPERVSLLLAHNPRYLDTYLQWGADLTLCGHYHGGLVRLWGHRGMISPDLVPFSSKCYGSFEQDGRFAVVTSGCGEHTIPIRLFNPREIVSVTVEMN